MLPPFDGNGNLPPGVHRCAFDELAERFGSGSPEREAEVDELAQFVAWATEAGVRRLIVNGSFVTMKVSPNDVDIVILPGPDYPRDRPSATELTTHWPFIQVVVAADGADLDAWVTEDFGSDRDLHQKGVVEVIL